MGSIKLRPSGFETSAIAIESRDKAVYEFFDMKNLAQEDRFLCVPGFYEHPFSYGLFGDFMYGNITELLQKPTLKGIAAQTIEYARSLSYQRPCFESLACEIDFNNCESPQAIGAYSDGARCLPDYVCNPAQWQQWHLDWLTKNPHLIEWRDSANIVFPYPDIIRDYLGGLLRKEFSMAWHTNQFSCQIGETFHLRQGQEVNAFHYCLGHFDERERISKTKEIGGQICKINHYVYLEEASRLEHEASGSIRHIYGLKRNHVWQFISLDTRHGFMEFIDCHGNHLGEKRFDGSDNAGAEVDHGFLAMNRWVGNL